MKTSFRHLLAFTLIEILFIIVIIGIITAISLTSFQQRSLNTKVDKTALQMQQILQAANTYFSAWGCWPNSSSCPNNAPAFNYYLPLGNSTNPWGTPYTFAADPNQSNNFLVYSGNLPNAQIASRVAGFLPNANIDSQNLQQVIVSSQAQANSIMFQYFGTVTLNNGDTAPPFSFNCPKNWIGNASAIPIGIATDKQTCWVPSPPPVLIFTGSKVISLLQPLLANACLKSAGPNQDNYSCTFSLTFLSNMQTTSKYCAPRKRGGAGSVTLMQMGYCQPPS